MLTDHQKNIATYIHLSTFSRFLIPLGNFIAPAVLWILNKDKSNFIDAHVLGIRTLFNPGAAGAL